MPTNLLEIIGVDVVHLLSLVLTSYQTTSVKKGTGLCQNVSLFELEQNYVPVRR